MSDSLEAKCCCSLTRNQDQRKPDLFTNQTKRFSHLLVDHQFVFVHTWGVSKRFSHQWVDYQYLTHTWLLVAIFSQLTLDHQKVTFCVGADKILWIIFSNKIFVKGAQFAFMLLVSDRNNFTSKIFHFKIIKRNSSTVLDGSLADNFRLPYLDF